MTDKRCPKCESYCDLSRRVTLTIYPTNWLLCVGFITTIFIFGSLLALGQGEIYLFAILGALPTIAALSTRICCDKCQVTVPQGSADSQKKKVS